MTSTRNNNSKSDYYLQQRAYENSSLYRLYSNGAQGLPYNQAIPTLGYTPSHMDNSFFSRNPVEIESALFGINSTNLVEPQQPVVPELKEIKTIPFFETNPIIMPLPLVIEKNQRPFPVPS